MRDHNHSPAIQRERNMLVTEECLDLIAEAAFVSPAAVRAWQLLRDRNTGLRGIVEQQRIIEARAAAAPSGATEHDQA